MVKQGSSKETPWGKELHQLNNNLGAILGFSTLLQRYLKDDDVGLEYTEKIRESVRDALLHAERLQQCYDGASSSLKGETVVEESSQLLEGRIGSSPQPPKASDSTSKDDTFAWQSLEGCESLLIVEDDSAFRALLVTFLQPLGYEIEVAADGLEALALFAERPNDFDLVLLDRDLPHKNGLQLAHDIRGIRSRIRLMLLSGTSAVPDENIDPQVFSAVLQKPIGLQHLGRAIRNVLDQSMK